MPNTGNIWLLLFYLYTHPTYHDKRSYTLQIMKMGDRVHTGVHILCWNHENGRWSIYRCAYIMLKSWKWEMEYIQMCIYYAEIMKMGYGVYTDVHILCWNHENGIWSIYRCAYIMLKSWKWEMEYIQMCIYYAEIMKDYMWLYIMLNLLRKDCNCFKKIGECREMTKSSVFILSRFISICDFKPSGLMAKKIQLNICPHISVHRSSVYFLVYHRKFISGLASAQKSERQVGRVVWMFFTHQARHTSSVFKMILYVFHTSTETNILCQCV